MDIKCKKNSQLAALCRLGLASTVPPESFGSTTTSAVACIDPANARGRGVVFDMAASTDSHVTARVPIPGYDAPALPLKPVRDPSLSLIGLSGIDPSGPIMVEVPLVQNNSAFTADRVQNEWRVGFAECYERGVDHEPIEHSPLFLRALDVLRLAGAQLVPVPAQRANDSLALGLHTGNEIDGLITRFQLDALVSDSHSAAFHEACWSGYPALGEPLGEATLWFYGARWSKDLLPALVQGYRSVRRLQEV
ncbi:hypothetical protein LVW35_22230 [Pseudomonas sp. HN11]|uniref:hypothetical protein n=1 Tax=Pseudomonas sp. HN11 TaxID=1344094 RepID=UPI001F26B866|nr:hypothetical protein [Pseudomonas sp. HN11]UII70352.1 hypothetical protein LVW35_22230 [Pseudomonas sp. HN11]